MLTTKHIISNKKNHDIFQTLDKFCRYDFGTEKNIEIYGQEEPPEYDVTKITAPVALYWSDNDWLAEPVVSIESISLIHLHMVKTSEIGICAILLCILLSTFRMLCAFLLNFQTYLHLMKSRLPNGII